MGYKILRKAASASYHDALSAVWSDGDSSVFGGGLYRPSAKVQALLLHQATNAPDPSHIFTEDYDFSVVHVEVPFFDQVAVAPMKAGVGTVYLTDDIGRDFFALAASHLPPPCPLPDTGVSFDKGSP